MALGAAAGSMIRLVVGWAVGLAVTGLGVGLAAAWALSQFVKNLLFGVSPGDPVTLIVASLGLLGVAVLAAYVPARRAARVDPMIALRYD